MPDTVDNIHRALMDDPDFKPFPGKTKDESAWAVSWSKYSQIRKNEKALSLTKQYSDDPNKGATSIQLPIGNKTTLANTHSDDKVRMSKIDSNRRNELGQEAIHPIERMKVLKSTNVLIDWLEKEEKKYIEPGESIPEGKTLHTGKRGGRFYLTEETISPPQVSSRLTPSERVNLDMGIASLRAGNLSDAIKSFNKVININPSNVRAYRDRGLAYMNRGFKGDFENSIKDFNKAIRLDPRNSEAYKRHITYSKNELRGSGVKKSYTNKSFLSRYGVGRKSIDSNLQKKLPTSKEGKIFNPSTKRWAKPKDKRREISRLWRNINKSEQLDEPFLSQHGVGRKSVERNITRSVKRVK